jgi:hypothetical protein
VALVPLTTSAAVVSGSAYPVIDGLLGISLVIHSHIGFDSILVDYLHDRKFPIIGPLAKWTLRVLTTGALVGVYAFNTQDVGASKGCLTVSMRCGYTESLSPNINRFDGTYQTSLDRIGCVFRRSTHVVTLYIPVLMRIQASHTDIEFIVNQDDDELL